MNHVAGVESFSCAVICLLCMCQIQALEQLTPSFLPAHYATSNSAGRHCMVNGVCECLCTSKELEFSLPDTMNTSSLAGIIFCCIWN